MKRLLSTHSNHSTSNAIGCIHFSLSSIAYTNANVTATPANQHRPPHRLNSSMRQSIFDSKAYRGIEKKHLVIFRLDEWSGITSNRIGIRQIEK